MLNTKQPSSRGSVAALLTTVIVLAVAVFAALNSQLILDTANYYQYQPSTAMASFVTEAGLSDKGKFLLYASHPSLDDAATFNNECSRTEAATAILGCYDGQKIYVYNVTDPRLTAVRPVTTAHEMLHAAYRRLSASERQRVNTLLEAEYDKIKTDKSVADRMAFYDRTEPGERNNELHSVIGTEVGPIDADLEAYYRTYFSDRSKVVALHDQYSALFADIQAQADQLSAKIDTLNQKIKDASAAYNSESAALQQDITSFNARARRGDFSSQAAFNSERGRLVARSSALEASRANINSLIEEYNRLVAELNSLSVKNSELNRSLDSNLAPAPSL